METAIISSQIGIRFKCVCVCVCVRVSVSVEEGKEEVLRRRQNEMKLCVSLSRDKQRQTAARGRRRRRWRRRRLLLPQEAKRKRAKMKHGATSHFNASFPPLPALPQQPRFPISFHFIFKQDCLNKMHLNKMVQFNKWPRWRWRSHRRQQPPEEDKRWEIMAML